MVHALVAPKTLYNSQLSPKREIPLSAVPRWWELELMLLPSIKYDFTILRQVIRPSILLKTVHTLHIKIFFPLVPQGLMRLYKQVCIFIVYKQQVTPS